MCICNNIYICVYRYKYLLEKRVEVCLFINGKIERVKRDGSYMREGLIDGVRFSMKEDLRIVLEEGVKV